MVLNCHSSSKNIIAIHPGDSLSYVVLIIKTNSFAPTHNLHESIPTKSKAMAKLTTPTLFSTQQGSSYGYPTWVA